ncbi:hypothetical protein K504DRAFT_531487 [Pleomassaria siparia CBS 279.74]|uniref:Uncharacterized protein n=1 Tax=Pleomassaria siparia CBS 279.74 TaxID=1314801 RepID=A0A6G1KHS4_9PLEO|nr:hypothetical protein K504DRAFT_531487 [Pleomassaria siparia CBS 279.74]
MCAPEYPPLDKDPHVLAYRYREYMQKYPPSKAHGERPNPYFESLLANQDDPPEYATDPRSRAIRYSKLHYECYYQKKDIAMIVDLLEDADDNYIYNYHSSRSATTAPFVPSTTFDPTSATCSNMPSLTNIILTSAFTATNLNTITTIPSLKVGANVHDRCNTLGSSEYIDFLESTCANFRIPVTTTIVVDKTTSTRVISVTSVTPMTTVTGSPPNFTSAVPFVTTTTTTTIPIPISSATTKIFTPTTNTNGVTTTIIPVSLTTTENLIPTTDANGVPTTLTSKVVSSASPSSTPEPSIGAAAAVDPPVVLGSVRAGLLDFGIGLVGLVLAEL